MLRLQRGISCAILLCAIQLCGASSATAQDEPESKIALLVGINEYDRFGDLEFARNDAVEMEQQLVRCGFEVITCKGGSKAKVDDAVEEFVARTNSLLPEDIAMVFFAGHGNQMRNEEGSIEAYFLPSDAKKGNAESWVSIGGLAEKLSTLSGAENNLILVDTCRTRAFRGFDGESVHLGINTSIFYACSYNEESIEVKDIKNGVFTHFVIQGLSGLAADRAGRISWYNLVSFVKEEVKRYDRTSQKPNFMSNLKSMPVLRYVQQKDERTEQEKQQPTEKKNEAGEGDPSKWKVRQKTDSATGQMKLSVETDTPPSRHQNGRYRIVPKTGWKQYNAPQSLLQNLTVLHESGTGGFIQSTVDWQKYWAITAPGEPLPQVDFANQMLVVETCSAPKFIESEVYSTGKGGLEIDRNLSVDEGTKTGKLNVDIKVIDVKWIFERLPMRFGVSCKEAADGKGMEVIHAVEGSASYHGMILKSPHYWSLDKGDVILSINGKETNTIDDFIRGVQGSGPIMKVQLRNIWTGEVDPMWFVLD